MVQHYLLNIPKIEKQLAIENRTLNKITRTYYYVFILFIVFKTQFHFLSQVLWIFLKYNNFDPKHVTVCELPVLQLLFNGHGGVQLGPSFNSTGTTLS